MLPRIENLPAPSDWKNLLYGLEVPQLNNFSPISDLWNDQLLALLQSIEIHIHHEEENYLTACCREKIIGVTNRQPYERL